MRRYAEREGLLFFLDSCAGAALLLRTKRRRRRAEPALGNGEAERPAVPWSMNVLLRAFAPLSPAQNACVQGCVPQNLPNGRAGTPVGDALTLGARG
ncbi:uncharacterized protein SOCE836_059610 [Sorangium cellulosum]|uniref:Uncharacterized protein n=1 Tax=Sorangium cellulosum TaxID=56 RepID=A0A4P2QTV9_SORCE|nr:uncharacterized protein SOCE836_059610 [Sorangium cellulosum]WCQ93106.1 hypothetical protein NQZ70_05854 [Sorangium sp. Soce836]